MSRKPFTYVLLNILFFYYTNCYSIHINIPEINDTYFNATSHLENSKVKMFCSNRDSYCQYDGVNVCTFRNISNSASYKDFTNVCYMFLSNMCDNPGEEFDIISSGSCERYLAQRRNEEVSGNETNTEKTSILRNNKTLSTLYSIKKSYDAHSCPYSCPNIYAPQCININRGRGKYFKIMSFINHCMSDLYYCQHHKEFDIPPGAKYPIVIPSKLSWTYCGASRYIQFARFSEVVSSMGHFGWLEGNYKFSHIMEPHERLP